MLAKKSYTVRPIAPELVDADLGAYHPLIRKLLHHRGVSTTESARHFLAPDYEAHTHDPFLLKDMEKVVSRIFQAIDANETIIIFSDYDADGIPGAVAFHDFFVKIGYENFENYIPHRHNEGFGLNIESLKSFAKNGAKLVISIDCGIANIKEAAIAKKLGLDLIVTDHHLPGVVLPDAFAIINPKQVDCIYPEKMLCGSGVIFKVIQALVHRGNSEKKFSLVPGWEKWLLDMVGLATLSDMVPLTGENRALASFGLMVMRKSPRIGFMKLVQRAKIDQRYITEDDIGFTITPRINAASRMGVPMDAFRLLAAKDENVADALSRQLEGINNERKGIVAAMVKDAKKKIISRSDSSSPMSLIVLGNPDWKPSLLGLVANSLAQEFHVPVFLWGRDGEGIYKGSCRSDGRADLVAIMNAVTSGVFIEYGGHAFSGGFSVDYEKIHTLPDEMVAAYKKLSGGAAEATPSSSEVLVDEALALEDVSWDLYEGLAKLAPFGVGNPRPLFIFRDVIPHEVKNFGKEGNHLEISFRKKNGGKVSAIGFFMNADTYTPAPVVGTSFDLIATIEKSMFRGRTELRLRICDIVSRI